MNRKFVAFSLVVISLLFSSINVGAAESGALLSSDKISWTIDDDGVLTVTGTGDMPNATNGTLPFRDKKSVVKSIVISGDITSIGDYVFSELSGATALTITAPIKHTGNYSFAYCTGLEKIDFSTRDYLETIGEASFACCSALKSVNIPENVKTIGAHAFAYCTQLNHIYFPKSVKTIGNYAFNYCMAMEWVTFEENVESIGDGAFARCTGLKRVNSLNPVPPVMNCDYDSSCEKDSGKSQNVFDKNTYDTATFRSAEGYFDAYKVADGWKHFKHSAIFTGVNEVTSTSINVYGANGEIIVEGAEDNAVVELYNLHGQQLYRGQNKAIATSTAGVYVVKVGDKVYKVIVGQ